MDGQKKLKSSSVLLIGAGGLGSPLALYLAAAGVGRIGIVDFDVVDESNLQRQVIHGTADVGTPKLESAKAAHRRTSTRTCRWTATRLPLTSENALELFEPYDVIVDGTDNFPTRYLVNDACVLLGKPNVYGSIFRFEGQASVFWAEYGPCYRCLYPEPPPPGLVPSLRRGRCAGHPAGHDRHDPGDRDDQAAAGHRRAADRQAAAVRCAQDAHPRAEAAQGPRLPGVRRAPDRHRADRLRAVLRHQPADGARRDRLRHHAQTARRRGSKRGDNLVLLDVREPNEWQIARLEGATADPREQRVAHASELSTADEIVLYCKSGRTKRARPAHAAPAGLPQALEPEGGIINWINEIDPSLPRY